MIRLKREKNLKIMNEEVEEKEKHKSKGKLNFKVFYIKRFLFL